MDVRLSFFRQRRAVDAAPGSCLGTKGGAACLEAVPPPSPPPPSSPRAQAFGALPAAQRRRLAAFRRDLGSRRLQRVWRDFCSKHKSTHSLVRAFVAVGLMGERPHCLAGAASSERLRGCLAAWLHAPRAGGASTARQTVCPSPPAGEQPAPTLAPAPHAAAAAASPALVMMGGMSGGQSRSHMAFEEFAGKLQAPATLRATQVRRAARSRSRSAAASSRQGPAASAPLPPAPAPCRRCCAAWRCAWRCEAWAARARSRCCAACSRARLLTARWTATPCACSCAPTWCWPTPRWSSTAGCAA